MLYWWGHSWETIPEENDMRIMAFVLVAALAACFANPVAAAQGRVNYYRGNPDRGPYPVSRFCERSGSCWRSGHQKIQYRK
jgi:hypothetical protein